MPGSRSGVDKEDCLRFLLKTTGSDRREEIIPNMERLLSSDAPGSINCPPFIINHHDYRACLQVRLPGESVSLSVAIVKSEKDKNLTWPFGMTVIFRLVNQSSRKHREKMFRCDKNGSRLRECLSKPKGAMNLAMGYPQFISKQCLVEEGFVRNNAMIVECYFIPKDTKVSLPSEVPSVIR